MASTGYGDSLPKKAHDSVVGVIAGSVGSTSMRAASDLSIVLDNGGDLRLIASEGKGSFQSIVDLLFLRGIDAAIVQRDVLELGRQEPLPSEINQQIRYITRLFDQEVHIVANQRFPRLEALRGQQVSVGLPDSDSSLTGTRIFELLAIPIEKRQLHPLIALKKLKAGEIAAMVYVDGQPAPLLQSIEPKDGLHLLPIPYTPELIDRYRPAAIDASSYPGLTPKGLAVDTLAIEAVLAVYNWPEGHARHDKVRRFVDAFFSRIDDLREEPWHVKWLDVDLEAELHGWQRFKPAETWLAARAAQDESLTTSFQDFLASRDYLDIGDERKKRLYGVFKLQQAKAAKRYVFALVPQAVNSAYASVVRDGCVRASETMANVTCLYVGPGEHDPQEQAQILQQLIDQKVDGIAVSPADSPVVASVLRRAKQAKIPVIVLDNDLAIADRNLRHTFLGTNSYELGAEMARQAMAARPKGGKVCVALDTDRFRGRGAIRLQAIRAVLANDSGTRRLTGQNGWVEPEGCPIRHEANTQAATRMLALALAKNPDLDVFIATDDITQSADDDFRAVMEPYKEHLLSGDLRMIMPDTLDVQMGQLRDGLTSIQIGQRPFETGHRALTFLRDIAAGYEVIDPAYTGLDVCSRNEAEGCTSRPALPGEPEAAASSGTKPP